MEAVPLFRAGHPFFESCPPAVTHIRRFSSGFDRGGGKGWFERGDKRLKFIRKRRGEGEGRSKLNIFFFFGNIFGEIS